MIRRGKGRAPATLKLSASLAILATAATVTLITSKRIAGTFGKFDVPAMSLDDLN